MRDQSQSGMVLMEVLISIAVGSLLLVVTITVLSDLIEISELQKRLAAALDQESWLMQVLPNRIRQAGLRTCPSESSPRHPVIKIYQASEQAPRWLTQRYLPSDAMVISGCRPYKGKFRWIDTAYYIAKASFKDHKKRSILALYQKVKGGRREVLMLNVRDLIISHQFIKQDHPQVAHVGLRQPHVGVSLLSITAIMQLSDVFVLSQSIVHLQGRTYTVQPRQILKAVPLWVALREQS